MAESTATRIVVSCDTSPLGRAALDAAAALARRLDAELTGLFVEDINLVRLAALPFAREYAVANAAARNVDAAELAQTLRRQAEAVRGALSRAAQALQVPWSFQVVRGAMLDAVLEAMREPGLAVLGYAGQFVVSEPAPPARRTGRYDESRAPRQPVLVLFDDTPVAQRALQVAVALAKDHHTPLVALIVAKTPADAQGLRGQVTEQLAGSGITPRFHALPARDVGGVKKAAQTHHAAALLWAGLASADERKALARVVDELTCPVLLVT